ncbi:MAG: XRE family transcriptional regulator [Phycisphaerales bacterium]|nr:XRE family transcriptional regulator [Phycisphaerales bacterium]
MAKSFAQLARENLTPAARVKARKRAKEITATIMVAQLRRSANLTQKQLAQRMGMSQPTLARIEKQGDIKLTTLHRIITGLGGTLTITAKLPTGSIQMAKWM